MQKTNQPASLSPSFSASFCSLPLFLFTFSFFSILLSFIPSSIPNVHSCFHDSSFILKCPVWDRCLPRLSWIPLPDAASNARLPLNYCLSYLCLILHYPRAPLEGLVIVHKHNCESSLISSNRLMLASLIICIFTPDLLHEWQNA